MPDQQNISPEQLAFLLQEKQMQYDELLKRAKRLVDAAAEYSKSNRDQKKFIILKNCETDLRNHIYPKPKQTRQAIIDWLAQ